jgi:hypothetical protein
LSLVEAKPGSSNNACGRRETGYLERTTIAKEVEKDTNKTVGFIVNSPLLNAIYRCRKLTALKTDSVPVTTSVTF